MPITEISHNEYHFEYTRHIKATDEKIQCELYLKVENGEVSVKRVESENWKRIQDALDKKEAKSIWAYFVSKYSQYESIAIQSSKPLSKKRVSASRTVSVPVLTAPSARNVGKLSPSKSESSLNRTSPSIPRVLQARTVLTNDLADIQKEIADKIELLKPFVANLSLSTKHTREVQNLSGGIGFDLELTSFICSLILTSQTNLSKIMMKIQTESASKTEATVYSQLTELLKSLKNLNETNPDPLTQKKLFFLVNCFPELKAEVLNASVNSLDEDLKNISEKLEAKFKAIYTFFEKTKSTDHVFLKRFFEDFKVYALVIDSSQNEEKTLKLATQLFFMTLKQRMENLLPPSV